MAELTVEEANALVGTMVAPWVRELGITIEAIGPDGVSARLPWSERLHHSGGVVCGQALLSLADTVMLFAIMGALGGYRPMTTVNQSTSFMKSISGVDILAGARILRTGRTMAFGEVLIRAEGSDEPAVHVTSAFAFLGPRADTEPNGSDHEQ